MLFNRILVNLSLLCQGKITLRQIPPKIINRVFNYCRLARHAKRSSFAINDVIFRTIDENDKTRYAEFINDYLKRSKTEMENQLSIPQSSCESFCFLALFRDRIAGKVELRNFSCGTAGIWQVGGLSVLENLRGFGIGEELLRRAIAAVSRNNSRFVLDVNKDNARAIKLYKKLGFRLANEQERSEVKTIYPRYYPEKIIMFKRG